jgi:phospholipid/cholesterol/gamma-HCH transport system substrate-binding protein
MKRIAAIAAALVVAIVLVVLATGSGGDGDTYQVRAIFKNAFTIIPGEDVKVAGVVVGSIGALETSSGGHRAAVVLNIDTPGFDDFRQDASCTIRPQSFIGERYVECSPTQPRPVGQRESPKLKRIEHGPGKGQYLLPVQNNVTPVDIDLVNNIMRLPFRQRLTVLLNEFGIALGARGKDLSTAIREANPALRDLDKVLAIVSKQNRVLGDLAVDSDAVLRPLAKDRKALADSFTKTNAVNEATLSRSPEFRKNLELLPTFLKELTPTMQQLQGFSEAFTPVLQNLQTAAPDLNTLFSQLPAFARAGSPALQTLGNAADAGTKALVDAGPLVKDVGTLGKTLVPTTGSLNDLLQSFKKTGGVDRLMDFIYYGVAATNGYDTFGHYLRAELLTNLCTRYTIQTDPKCDANFNRPEDTATSRSVSDPGATSRTAGAPGTKDAIALPSSVLPGGDAKGASAGAQPPATGDKAADAGADDPSASLLNYVLGDG